MIQVRQADHARYAVRLVPRARRGERLARSVQSAAASELLAELRARTGMAEGPASKSHSRDLVGVAGAPRGVVGVDVEYRAPGRPIEAIARHLLDAQARDEIAAYRVFTFREAYFKALGEWPEKALLRRVAEAVAPTYALDRALRVLHEPVDDDFYLTLVWRVER